MKKSAVITFLFLLAATILNAQDIKKSQAQPDSIIKVIPYADGRHVIYVYSVGGRVQSPEEIKLRLLSYNPSAAEYHKVENNITWAYISGGGFVAGSIGSLIAFAHSAKQSLNSSYTTSNGTIVDHEPNFTARWVFTGIATGFAVAALINIAKAGKHGKKAIDLYNQRFE